MKKFLFMAAALVAMASCSKNDYFGDSPTEAFANGQELTSGIVFSSTNAKMTRSNYEGADAASKLGNNFVVEGVKSMGTIDGSAEKTVFDHYNVNYVDGSAHSTTSNTDGWEYVAQAKHAHSSAAEQTIKYWDYAKSQYDFIAYSKGTATEISSGTPTAGQVLISAITPSTLKGKDTNDDGKIDQGAYTIQGAADDLAKVYIADLATSYKADDDYQKTVQFTFRPLAAKVRVALYETVPGYSVKDVVFYTAASTVADDGKAHLYTTGTDVFNAKGTYIVYYPTTGYANKSAEGYNKAHVFFTPDVSGTSTVKAFGPMDLTNTGADKEKAEAVTKYIGRSSDKATYAGDNAVNHYTVVIPNETGAVLNLKVNYTLVSIDGSGEDINVTGATAKVPAVYASWKSGYAYTYIFKISQDSNGYTGETTDPSGLYPITFDAVVVNDEVDGVQETITTVSDPSITTYTKGAVVTANNEYVEDKKIYVVVENGTALTVGTNAKLYTATLETGAAQTLNESTIANALERGGAVYDAGTVLDAGTDLTGYYTQDAGVYTAATGTADGTTTYYQQIPGAKAVKDANGKKLVVTPAAGLTAVTSIPAADTPTGTTMTVNGAVFTPADPGTYVFEYTDGSDKKHYKIIIVVAAS